jgi:hypothetical protein
VQRATGNMTKEAMEQFDRIAADVAAGRNRIKGRIDQGMPHEVAPAGRLISEGEAYGFWNPAKESNTAAFRAGQGLAPGPTKELVPTQKATSSLDTTTRSLNKRGGRDNFSPISLTLSPQTTINGASAGQEQATARQFERVLQNSNREFLAKLKELQNDDQRLAYT